MWAWKDLTAADTPDSVFIFAATSLAAALVSGSRHWVIDRARFSAVRERCGIGEGPAPVEATMLPQKGWLHIISIIARHPEEQTDDTYSPKKGTISVGVPLASPQAVVPAPPW